MTVILGFIQTDPRVKIKKIRVLHVYSELYCKFVGTFWKYSALPNQQPCTFILGTLSDQQAQYLFENVSLIIFLKGLFFVIFNRIIVLKIKKNLSCMYIRACLITFKKVFLCLFESVVYSGVQSWNCFRTKSCNQIVM